MTFELPIESTETIPLTLEMPEGLRKAQGFTERLCPVGKGRQAGAGRLGSAIDCQVAREGLEGSLGEIMER